MPLNLSTHTESILRQEADRAGISVDTLIERTFARKASADSATRVQNLLAQWQAEYGLPVPPGGFKSLAELSAEWATEDAERSDEEIAAERAAWQEHERAVADGPGVQI